MEALCLRPDEVRLPRLTIHEQLSRCGETEAEGLSAKTCQHANGTKDAARGWKRRIGRECGKEEEGERGTCSGGRSKHSKRRWVKAETKEGTTGERQLGQRSGGRSLGGEGRSGSCTRQAWQRPGDGGSISQRASSAKRRVHLKLLGCRQPPAGACPGWRRGRRAPRQRAASGGRWTAAVRSSWTWRAGLAWRGVRRGAASRGEVVQRQREPHASRPAVRASPAIGRRAPETRGCDTPAPGAA